MFKACPGTFVTLFGVLLMGCAPAASIQASTNPSPGPIASPIAVVLSGRWQSGDGAEPAAGPKTITFECSNTYARSLSYDSGTWDLQQSGDDVSLTSHQDVTAGPTGPDPTCPAKGLTASGTFVGGVLKLNGEQVADTTACPSAGATQRSRVSLELTYHADTGHLVGTLAGQPIWAQRLVEVDPPASCGSTPVS